MGLGTVLALAWSLAQPVGYTASTQVLVPAGAGGAEVVTQRVTTHAALATSPEVLAAAAESLNAGLGRSSAQRTSADLLALRVQARPVPGAGLLQISAVGDTAARAREVAAAVAVQLLARTRALEPATAEPAVLARAAVEPGAADEPSPTLAGVTGGASGALLGAGAGAALTLRRRRRRGRSVITRAEAAAAGGVPVLATLAWERSGPVPGARSGRRAEAVRQLRTAVRFTVDDVRTLVVTSPGAVRGAPGSPSTWPWLWPTPVRTSSWWTPTCAVPRSPPGWAWTPRWD